jgi:hypothetical protein
MKEQVIRQMALYILGTNYMVLCLGLHSMRCVTGMLIEYMPTYRMDWLIGTIGVDHLRRTQCARYRDVTIRDFGVHTTNIKTRTMLTKGNCRVNDTRNTY